MKPYERDCLHCKHWSMPSVLPGSRSCIATCQAEDGPGANAVRVFDQRSFHDGVCDTWAPAPEGMLAIRTTSVRQQNSDLDHTWGDKAATRDQPGLPGVIPAVVGRRKL